MARLLFAAHDPGGARMLWPVIALADQAGYDLYLLASGPAGQLWKGRGFPVHDVVSLDPISKIVPEGRLDLVVTGTSGVSDLERELWRAARRSGIPTLAVVDRWYNVQRRFLTTGTAESVQPDVIGVPTSQCAVAVHKEGWCRSALRVVGHPYLQQVRRQRLSSRSHRKWTETGPAIGYFSEPYAGTEFMQSYDQFHVGGYLLQAISPERPVRLMIKPHPREEANHWHQWLKKQTDSGVAGVRVTDEAVGSLLDWVDGVVGITTTVLLEAALAGIPALSIQINSRRLNNPRIGETDTIPVVTSRENIPRAVWELCERCKGSQGPTDPQLLSMTNNADKRLFQVLAEVMTV